MNVSIKCHSAKVTALLGLMHVFMTTHAKTTGAGIGYGVSRETAVQMVWNVKPSKKYLVQLRTSVKRYCAYFV
jgi:hypothetical protein